MDSLRPEHQISPEDIGHRRTFVEVGYGFVPAFDNRAGNEVRTEYFQGVNYIGVDANPDPFVQEMAKRGSRHGGDEALACVGFNRGTLSDLQLPEASVDEVYVANVFAEREAEVRGIYNQLPAMWQALKPGGQLTVVETNTPTPREHLIEALRQAGFEIEAIIDEEDPVEWNRYHTRYAIPEIGPQPGYAPPYILTARKVEAEHTVGN
jgi:ubiquinone/menaquinone biosynthesis C-methylase UbiE